MTKIAINTTWGGFHLSKVAVAECNTLGLTINEWGCSSDNRSIVSRNDPILIQVIESLGDQASQCAGDIKLIEIPDDVDDWYIMEYDGQESIHEGRQW